MATDETVTEDLNTPAVAADPAPAPADAPASDAAPVEVVAPAASVVVDNANRAYAGGDTAALSGHFVRVTGGEHAGRYAVLLETATVGPDGLPDTVVIRTRDDDDMRLVVDYRDLAPAAPGGR